MRLRTGFVMVAVLAAAASPLTPATRPPAEVPAAIVRELREAILAWAAEPDHRGVSAAVVLPNGALWVDAAGLAGRDEPLRADHLLLVASVTKTMTGALILQLVDEGVLRLEDPIGRWLAPRRHIDPAITMRQLLNHTNGLANYSTASGLSAAIAADRSRVFTAEELLTFVGPPRFAPGTDTEYTNTAFLLLGLVAEAATGRSLVELYHQRLWDPLDLDEIYLPGFEEPPGPVAEALAGPALVWPLNRTADLTAGNSAAGLLSNARTIARWGHALFLGRVISVDGQRAMRTLVAAAGNIPGESGAGLGIRAYHYLDRTQFGHSGGSAMGSSLLLHDPGTGVTVAVIMNQGQGAEHFVLAPRLLEITTAR